MICYVDMDHPRTWADPTARARRLGTLGLRKLRFEALSGEPCLTLHYTQLDAPLVGRLGLRALLLSGSTVDWDECDLATFEPLTAILRTVDLPTIAFCGGHQYLGWAFGADWGPVGRLAPGEADPAPHMAPGFRKEVGFMPVDIVADDPLFAGLGAAPVMFESHYWQLTDVPAGWRLLATRPTCRVQAMRHPTRPIYGTQFHPEQWDADHLAGRQCIANFFALAGLAPAADTHLLTRWRELSGTQPLPPL